MIEGFPNKRRRNCETGVFANMAEYYGMQISEPLVFGIGSGIYFVYSPHMQIRKIVYPILRTQPCSIVMHAARRLRLGYHGTQFKNDEDRAMLELDKLLQKQIPTAVVVNVNGLQYFNVSGMETDFNGHVFTVIGKENSDYLVADTDNRLINDDFVTVSESLMRKIRFASGFSAPDGEMFYLDPIPEHYSLESVLRKAMLSGLRQTCQRMLDIPLDYYGCKGFHFFARDIREWDKKCSQKEIKYVLMWYYRLFERTGTGGAGYRFIYADFLKEMAEMYQDEWMGDCALKMSETADLWRQFSLSSRRFLKGEEVTLDDMAEIMDAIGDNEFLVFSQIRDKVLRND